MATIQKHYHRGNNDAAEANTLTAVFDIKLIIAENCISITIDVPDFFVVAEETGFFLPDFLGDDAIAFARTLTLPEGGSRVPPEMPPRPEPHGEKETAQQTASGQGQAADAPARAAAGPIDICLGTMPVEIAVDITSPAGKGNGEAQAGVIAAQFGLEHNGVFSRFNGGPLAPGSEHWNVSQKVQVAAIPCTGGVSKGSLNINFGVGAPAAYTVTWDVSISACGVIDKSDITLVQGAFPRNLGMGGRIGNILQEVAAGDPLPFPVRDQTGLPGNSPIRVGPGGQPSKLP